MDWIIFLSFESVSAMWDSNFGQLAEDEFGRSHLILLLQIMEHASIEPCCHISLSEIPKVVDPNLDIYTYIYMHTYTKTFN